jgi:hypothetical protein
MAPGMPGRPRHEIALVNHVARDKTVAQFGKGEFSLAAPSPKLALAKPVIEDGASVGVAHKKWIFAPVMGEANSLPGRVVAQKPLNRH